MRKFILLSIVLMCAAVAHAQGPARTDPCKVSFPTSLGNGYTLVDCLGQTSNGTSAPSQTVTLPVNPTIGNTLIIGNGQCSTTTAGCPPGTYTAGALYNSDTLGNKAQGTVNTNGQVVTLDFGNGFGVQGCHYAGGCIWAGGTISINGANYVIQSVINLTTLTITTSAGNQTNVPYIGPGWGCTESGSVNVAVISVCWAYVSTTGTDNVTVFGPNNYALSESIAEISPPSGHGGPLSIDVAGCPIQSCGQIWQVGANSSPTTFLAQGNTTNADELVWAQGNFGTGSIFQQTGWTPLIMGTHGANHTDNSCSLTGFCTNETQVELETFATAQQVQAQINDDSPEDDGNIQYVGFAPGDTPVTDTPNIYVANESCGLPANPNFCNAPNAPMAFAVPLTNPSVMVVCGTYNTGSPTPSDTAGNTWIDWGPGAVPYDGGPPFTQCWYAQNTTNFLQDKITWSGSMLSAVSAEFVGVTTKSPIIDTFGSNPNATSAGGTGAINTGGVTTTIINDLLIGAYFPFTGPAVSVGSGFTAVMAGMFTNGALFYKIQPTAALVNPGAVEATSNDPYGGETVAFKNAIVPNSYSQISVIIFGVP